MKIISIYVLDDGKKQEYINMINDVDQIDILYEIDIRLNDVMKDLGKLAIKLIDGADKSAVFQFKSIINSEIIKTIRKKEESDRLLEEDELNELEKNLDLILENF